MWETTTTVIVPQPSGKLMIVAFIAGGNVLQGWTPTPCNGQISTKKENGPDVTHCDE
jgi:hypothetical protein